MKKAILSLAILAAVTFAACSGDDNNDNNANAGCLTCTLTVEGTTDSDVICNVDGTAVEDGDDTEVDFEDYIQLRRDAGYTCN